MINLEFRTDLFNGMSLKWSCNVGPKSVVVGDMRINKFEEITSSSVLDTLLLTSKQGQR
jgi:hypothetical protein